MRPLGTVVLVHVPGSWRRHQQLVGLVLVALLAALACLALGRWQWDRYHTKHERRQLVAANYDAPAIPVRDVLPAGSRELDPRHQWRPVRAAGRYDVGATTLVRNRARDASGAGPQYGYEVLVPLVLDDGTALLVDRGWLPNGTRGDRPGQQPDVVPPPPSGRVEVVARLRPSEPDRAGQTPPGQVATISVDRVARGLAYPLLPAYGVLASERPTPDGAPALLARPRLDGGEGINASYAVQWVLFATLALGFPFWFVRRQRALATQPRDLHRAEPARAEPARADQAHPRPPRRRRIWDDEDE